MDGKSLKQFVENDQTWSKFVNERFAMLNKSHTGKLTHTELEPAIAGVGSALGLPPMGTDAETDHIYTEVPFSFYLRYSLPQSLFVLHFCSFRRGIVTKFRSLKKFITFLSNGLSAISMSPFLASDYLVRGEGGKCS